MEIVAHTLWAAAAAKATNRRTARIGLVWFAIWAMFPDLFAFSPEVIAGLWNRITGSVSAHVLDFHHVGARWGWLDVDLYDIGHSFVTFVAVFLIVWAIIRRPLWEMLGWALHILLDIPSHSAHYPTPFLWPLSSYYISGCFVAPVVVHGSELRRSGDPIPGHLDWSHHPAPCPNNKSKQTGRGLGI